MVDYMGCCLMQRGDLQCCNNLVIGFSHRDFGLWWYACSNNHKPININESWRLKLKQNHKFVVPKHRPRSAIKHWKTWKEFRILIKSIGEINARFMTIKCEHKGHCVILVKIIWLVQEDMTYMMGRNATRISN